MEAFEKQQARDRRRLDKSILDPVIVKNVNDIKRVIAEFDPNKNANHSPLPLSAVMEAENEGGKKVQYNVSATTRSKSKRELLLEGFDLIKTRVEKGIEIQNSTQDFEVNGKTFKPAKLQNNIDGVSWIDPLIKQWTGGARKELLIAWDIGDGYEYRYDIYAHSFTRAEQREG